MAKIQRFFDLCIFFTKKDGIRYHIRQHDRCWKPHRAVAIFEE